jgi:L1 cell adhesion molecule like protein
MKLWPFKVESGADDKPTIVVKFKGETKKFHAEEISSMVLTKMK